MPVWSKPSEERAYNPQQSALIIAIDSPVPGRQLHRVWKKPVQETIKWSGKAAFTANYSPAIVPMVTRRELMSLPPAAKQTEMWEVPIQEIDYPPTKAAMFVNCSPMIKTTGISNKPMEEAKYDVARSEMVVSGRAITHKHPLH